MQKQELFKAGDIVEGYTFEKKLGEGGFGQVWRVSKSLLPYAIKVVDDGNKAAQAEEDWAHGMRLGSPFLVNYVTSFRVTCFPRMLFIVMEYCELGSLEKYINDQKSKEGLLNFDIDRIVKILIQSSLGLYEMHGRGIYHRDMKAENILLTGNYDAKIGDFGLTRTMDSQSKATTFLGTPGYMAQEIMLGKPYDAKVDIYALGVMIFQLCTLQMPYDSMPDYMQGKHKLFPEYKFPEELSSLVYSMISAKPAERPSAQEILENPMMQKMAARIPFRSGKLLDCFPPPVLKPKPLPSAAPASEAEESFIAELAASHPDFLPADFRREFEGVFEHKATPAQCSTFLRLQRSTGSSTGTADTHTHHPSAPSLPLHSSDEKNRKQKEEAEKQQKQNEEVERLKREKEEAERQQKQKEEPKKTLTVKCPKCGAGGDFYAVEERTGYWGYGRWPYYYPDKYRGQAKAGKKGRDYEYFGTKGKLERRPEKPFFGKKCKKCRETIEIPKYRGCEAEFKYPEEWKLYGYHCEKCDDYYCYCIEL